MCFFILKDCCFFISDYTSSSMMTHTPDLGVQFIHDQLIHLHAFPHPSVPSLAKKCQPGVSINLHVFVLTFI